MSDKNTTETGGDVMTDHSRCRASVPDGGRSFRFHQCAKKGGHGPDGAYCAVHDPAKVAARRAASDAKWKAERDRERPKWFAHMMLDVLEQIAAGHNDAKALAAEAVAKVRK